MGNWICTIWIGGKDSFIVLFSENVFKLNLVLYLYARTLFFAHVLEWINLIYVSNIAIYTFYNHFTEFREKCISVKQTTYLKFTVILDRIITTCFKGKNELEKGHDTGKWNKYTKVETVADFTFLGSKITADGDCSHEIKRHLLLARKAMTKLNSILQSWDVTADQGPYSQSYGFSRDHVWMCKLDHKEYCQSIWLLSRVQVFATPWTAACQASLSITNFQSLLKLMSIEFVMPSNHLILCHPLFLPPSIFPSVRIFSKESVLWIR